MTDASPRTVTSTSGDWFMLTQVQQLLATEVADYIKVECGGEQRVTCYRASERDTGGFTGCKLGNNNNNNNNNRTT